MQGLHELYVLPREEVVREIGRLWGGFVLLAAADQRALTLTTKGPLF
jgi:hypothetical protein